MTKKILSFGDFIIAKEKISTVKKNSIGIIKQISQNKITVFFVGDAKNITINKKYVQYLDINKTGKPYKKKICNICHILKKSKKDFSINQTDAKGRKTTRPSCKECRKK